MKHFLLLLSLMASPALAQPVTTCAGQDLIAALDPAEKAGLDAEVARAPYPGGNHWKATKDGTTITLVGTFHLYDPRMEAVVRRLAPEIAAADHIYLEATETEMKQVQEAMVRRPELIVTSGATLPERLTPAEWQALSAAMGARGIPAFLASKFRPWYVSMLLAIPPCAMGGLASGSTGLDHLIIEAAKAAGKDMRALEPYDTIFAAFDRIAPDDQLDAIRLALTMETGAEDMMTTMKESYFREEHRMLWEFGRQQALARAGDQRARTERDFALMEQILISDRNQAWAGVLRAAPPGQRLLVAVGAGHLAGETGLLHLLEQDGYHLERLPF